MDLPFQAKTSVTKKVFVWIVLSLTIGSILTACGASNATSSADVDDPLPNSNGTMAHANLHGTGAYQSKGVVQPVGLQWKFRTEFGSVDSTPAISDGVVYFGGHDSFLYAVDAISGQARWKFKTHLDVTSSPAVADGMVFFESWDGNLYAVNCKNGQEQWRFHTSGKAFSNVAVAGGVVYVGSKDGLYALEGKTGLEKWSFRTTNDVTTTPLVVENMVYFADHTLDERKETLYAVDSVTGQERWRRQLTSGIAGSPAFEGGLIYFASRDGWTYAFDAITGQQYWAQKIGLFALTSPAVADGLIYFTVPADNGLYVLSALDARTGQERWRFQTDAILATSPAIAGEIVYFIGTQLNSTLGNPDYIGYLYGVDMKTGQETLRFSVVGNTVSTPAIVEGVVYFGGSDSYLYAVK